MPPIEAGWEWFVKLITESVLIAFLVGVWVDRFNCKAERRREFKVTVELALNKVEFSDDASFCSTYKSSVNEVRVACLRFEADIRRNKRDEFHQTWNDYCGLKDSDLGGSYQVTNPADMTPLLSMKYAFARKKVLGLLHRLIAFSG